MSDKGEECARANLNGDRQKKTERFEFDDSEITFRQALPQIKLSTISATFNVIVGVAFTFSAILIPQLEAPDNDIPGVTQFHTSLMASIMILSVPVGSVAAGFIMDRIGRINTIRCSAIPSILGQVLMATATNVELIIIGRLFTGISCAMGVSPSIVYTTEIAHKRFRGSLVSLGPTIASFSMIFVFLGGAHLNWRTVAWLGIVFTCAPIFLTFFLKESPIFLVARNRDKDAINSLNYLYSRYPNSEEVVKLKLGEIKEDFERKRRESLAQSGSRSSKLAGFLKPTGYKPLAVLFLFIVIQQFSGIYITLFFAVTFLQDIGIPLEDAATISFYLSVVRFILSCVSIYLLQKYSRRLLVMVSSGIMGIIIAVSGVFTLLLKQGSSQLSWVPVMCLVLYVCAGTIGLMPIPWSMTAELFPSDIRSLGQSISFSLGNLIMFSAILSYRSLLDIFGGSAGVQWFFAFVSFLGVMFALKILPETFNVELSQIQAGFAGKKSKNQQMRENHPLTQC